MSKRILVTGAAGFIGFHLSQSLKKRGDFVVGLDNYNDYYTPQLKRDRTQILHEEDIAVVEGDICDLNVLNELIETHKITHIAHLAAQAGVRYSIANPQAYIEANIQGFLNVLEACRHHEGVKLTYASSSSVYGLNTKTPFSTTDMTDRQASLYGATKKSNELMAQTYHHLYGIPVTGLRFFTVYGPWGRPDMAYFSFAQNILEGKPIKVFNHGKLQRDFTYIDDIIAGTVAAIDLESESEVFNLGNNQPVELGRFIEVIENALGKEAIKEYVPMQAGDVLTTYADIQKSQELLGYQPTTSIENGIAQFVDWFHNYAMHVARN